MQAEADGVDCRLNEQNSKLGNKARAEEEAEGSESGHLSQAKQLGAARSRVWQDINIQAKYLDIGR